MLLGLYKTVTCLSTPFLERYLKGRQMRGKEDPLRTHERRGQPALPRPQGRLIWCHAASVGESLSLLSMIRKIADENADMNIMVTTGTVTSARLMAERLPPRAFHQYIPVDHPRWVDGFLDYWRPDAVIWSESELWPNLLSAVAARKIPAMLLNARMSESSFAKWRFARGMARDILSVFDICLAQNDAEAHRLRVLGAKDVRVSANLKYAAEPLPVDLAALERLQAQTQDRKILLFASTHPGEEEIAITAHQSLSSAHMGLLTIVVPRHPSRGGQVAALVRAAGMSCALRSAQDAIDDKTQVYIADTLGELGVFFRLCPVVVMGGTFADIGGHNPIEPAHEGCLIVYGPQMYNFNTVRHDFDSAGAALGVEGVDALLQKLDDIFKDGKKYAPVRASAKSLVMQKAGVIEELMVNIRPFLKRSSGIEVAS